MMMISNFIKAPGLYNLIGFFFLHLPCEGRKWNIRHSLKILLMLAYKEHLRKCQSPIQAITN